MRRRHKQVEAAKRELAAELQRFPTEQEIADRLGVSEARWCTMQLDLKNVGLVSASTRTDNDDLPSPDYGSKPDSYPDAICMDWQLGSVLRDALGVLPPRYRQVVKLYYNREMKMSEIGAVMGINESRVSQIHKAAMEKLHAHLSERKLTFAALA